MVQSPNSPKAINKPVGETTGEKIVVHVQMKDVETANDSSGIAVIASENGKGSPPSSPVKMKKHKKGSFKSPANNDNNNVFCLSVLLIMSCRINEFDHLIC